jgi:hypothetical protein
MKSLKNNCPVLVGGQKSDGGGHAWVILLLQRQFI